MKRLRAWMTLSWVLVGGCYASQSIDVDAATRFDAGFDAAFGRDAGVVDADATADAETDDAGAPWFARDSGTLAVQRGSLFVFLRDTTGLAPMPFSVVELDPTGGGSVENVWQIPSPPGAILALRAWPQRDGLLRVALRLELLSHEQTHAVYVLDPAAGTWDQIDLDPVDERVVVATHPLVRLSRPSAENDFLVLTQEAASGDRRVHSTGVAGSAWVEFANGLVYAILEEGEVIVADVGDFTELTRFEIPYRTMRGPVAVEPRATLIRLDDGARTLVRSDWHTVVARGPTRVFEDLLRAIAVRADGAIAAVEPDGRVTIFDDGLVPRAQFEVTDLVGPNWLRVGWMDAP